MVLQKLVALDAASQVMGFHPQLIPKGMDFTDAAHSLAEHISHCEAMLRYKKTEGEGISGSYKKHQQTGGIRL